MRLIFTLALVLLSFAAHAEGQGEPRRGFMIDAPSDLVFDRLRWAMTACWPNRVSAFEDGDVPGPSPGQLVLLQPPPRSADTPKRFVVDVAPMAAGTRVVTHSDLQFDETVVTLDHLHRRVQEWAKGENTGC